MTPPSKLPGSQDAGGPADYPGGKTNQLEQRVAELWASLAQRDPFDLALCTGAVYHQTGANEGEFTLQLWESPVSISFPSGFTQQGDPPREVGILVRALMAYYFATSDGTPIQGRWISFAELPGGRFYARAYQGYTGAELIWAFGQDVGAIEKAACASGGVKLSLGDCSFSYQMLPFVSLAFVYWSGDDEFPSSCQVLFDSSASHHLPADACAIAGSMLTRRILSAQEI